MQRLTKIQVMAIFLMQDMQRNFFTQIYRDLFGDGHQHGGPEPTEKSYTEFCYKSMNSSLEELKNIIIIIPFLIQELFV